jgi:nicotinamide mononucleotide adenylyltransferase
VRQRVNILPGRHQPPHRDHLALIAKALDAVDGPLFLALIVSPRTRGRAPTELEREARRAHHPQRAPFSFVERLALIEAALAELPKADRVRVIALPRPEVSWPIVEAIFPEPRRWIVPSVGERFDDLKASFFRSRGDEVLRIDHQPTTDGRCVRALIAARDPALAEHVPRGVARLLLQRKETS